MPLWGWVTIGVLCWVAVAVGLGFALARLFGRLTRVDTTAADYQELLEFDLWSTAPLTRARTVPEYVEMIELVL